MLDAFKRRYCNTCLSRWWHRFAPAIVVKKRFFGATVFLNFRDNIDDVSRSTRELEHREGAVLSIPEHVDGDVWDVGANVGLFSVRASLVGRRCVAFELSPNACELLRRTRQQNNLHFEIIDRPLCVVSQFYTPPKDASAENAVVPAERGDRKTMTYQEAYETYGVPALIKMDIEGGEAAFFADAGFKQWVLDHAIVWLVEVHQQKIGFFPEWKDVPHTILDSSHYLYCADTAQIARLARLCGVEALR